MTQQKSEDRIVPQDRRKSVPTRGVERHGGGKSVPVEGVDQQLMLAFATAGNPRAFRGAESAERRDRSRPRARKVPKVKAPPEVVPSPSKSLEQEYLEEEYDLSGRVGGAGE